MTAHDYIYKVTATSENFGPFMLHRGIVFNDHGTDYVLHMTFGGPEVITLDTFKAKRTILNYRRYRLAQDVCIDDILYNLNDDKFEAINNNCEHFVNDFINTYTTRRHLRISEQVIFWAVIVTVIAIIIYKRKHS